MPTPTPHLMHPDDFQVNQTWLAYRVNIGPLYSGGTQLDMYVLQDAASMYLFGNAFGPHGTGYPILDDVEALMTRAHGQKDEWPTELVLPGTPEPNNTFIQVAHRHGISIRTVPTTLMSIYIQDAQEGYKEFISRASDPAYFDATPRPRRQTIPRLLADLRRIHRKSRRR